MKVGPCAGRRVRSFSTTQLIGGLVRERLKVPRATVVLAVVAAALVEGER
jgi:hypothetical protein